MRLKILVVLILACSILLNSRCDALAEDNEGPECWEPASAGPITTWTAPLCGKGKFAIQPFFFYNKTRGAFDSEGDYSSLPNGDKKYQFQQQLFVQYGLTDRLEIDGQVVYQQNYARQGEDSANSDGFGDSYLFLRYCALEETDTLPHITGLFQLKLPTGKYEEADPDKFGTDLMGATSGGGSYEHGYGINLTKKIKPFIFHADAIYSFPLEAKVDGVKTTYGKYLTYDFGAEYFLPKGFNFMLEFNGFLQGDREEDGQEVQDSEIKYLSVAPGVGWSCDAIQTLLAYQRTLIGTNTDANDSVVFTLVYTF